MSAQATVAKKFGKIREGRGFSRDELREVELDFRQALRLGLPIDMRRKTKRVENVKALKQFLRKK
ncbi:MAG: ribosomal protein L13e [Candidatus Bathyarchaeota archaeon]|nr:ribosomal protein L13e [Candidatus Bathyarchaeota archaeon]